MTPASIIKGTPQAHNGAGLKETSLALAVGVLDLTLALYLINPSGRWSDKHLLWWAQGPERLQWECTDKQPRASVLLAKKHCHWLALACCFYHSMLQHYNISFAHRYAHSSGNSTDFYYDTSLKWLLPPHLLPVFLLFLDHDKCSVSYQIF